MEVSYSHMYTHTYIYKYTHIYSCVCVLHCSSVSGSTHYPVPIQHVRVDTVGKKQHSLLLIVSVRGRKALTARGGGIESEPGTVSGTVRGTTYPGCSGADRM